MNSLWVVLTVLTLSSSDRFHLYYTDKEQYFDKEYFDCLHSFNQIDFYNAWSTVPYCMRAHSVTRDKADAECNGQLTSFKELKSKKVTTDHLFKWNAPVDTMDLYQKFLETNQDKLSKLKYCNCTDNSHFGTHCQYYIISFDTFTTHVRLVFRQRSSPLLQLLVPVACYSGLLSCKSLICLDWRQICDGIIDCIENGEDEQNCYQLEINECDSVREYRCKNGMCIDKRFLFDAMFDCLDRTDEVQSFRFHYKSDCYTSPSVECEELLCDNRRHFPCGDGNCFDYTLNYGSRRCENGRYHLKDTAMWDANTRLKENITMMYPSVRFFYVPQPHGDRKIVVCFNYSLCQLYLPKSSADPEGIVCQEITEFSWWPEESEQFHTLYYTIEKAFSACALPNKVNHSSLFHCPDTHTYISKYRVKDDINDCLFNSDELEPWESIYGLLNDRIKCLSTDRHFQRKDFYSSETICEDDSNNMLPFECMAPDDLGCQHLRYESIPASSYFLFQEICNGVIHPILRDDEADCEEWQTFCTPKYTTMCDGISQCADGRDEIRCTKNIEKETRYCRTKYPTELTRRYRCDKSSECIRIEQLCDRVKNCLKGDDERGCPSRAARNCSDGDFFCKDKCNSKDIRCNGIYECLPDCETSLFGCSEENSKENDERFCNLITNYPRYKRFSFDDYSQYPPLLANLVESTNSLVTYHPRMDNDFDLLLFYGFDTYYCYRGILIYSPIDRNITCFCPPGYYGARCEHQRERLTVHLKIQTPLWMQQNHLFKIVAFVETEANQFYDSFDLLYVPYIHNASYKHIFYLLTPRLNESQASLVSINVFSVSENDVTFHSLWLYEVPFTSIYPVNRVTAWLDLERESQISKNCNETCLHGVCILSQTAVSASICICDHGWSGKKCDVQSVITCAANARTFHSLCVCPVGRFGNNCYGKVDLCRNIKCRNNGTCRSLDIKSKWYFCICTNDYHGDLCEIPSAKLKITINKLIVDPSTVRVPIVTVHFANITSMVGLASIFDRFVYKNIPFDTNLTIMLPKQRFLPTFVFVQLAFNNKDYYGEYYLVSLAKFSVNSLYTRILISNRCPFIDQLLDSQTMSYPYIKRIKSYYKVCLLLGTKCFHDEKYMCLCDNLAQFDCFLFNHTASNCTDRGYCQNDGHCIQPVQKDQIYFDFACVCSDCYYGGMCQFTTAQYSISLDSLLGQQIYTGQSLNSQPFLIKLTLYILILMVILGSLNNTCCIIVFSQKNTHEVGCGLYLLSLSILSQLGLLAFGARFFYLLITQITHIRNRSVAYGSCITLEFIFSALSPIVDWLMACITVERSFTAVKGIGFDKKLSKKLSKYVTVSVIVIVTLSVLHKPFNVQFIDDPRSNARSWCVTKYEQKWIQKYEIATNIIHLTAPFVINLSSTLVFLISLTRRISLSSLNKDRSYYSVLKELVLAYKPFVISPIIIVVLELPRLILAFAFACIRFQWQKNVYLASYLVSTLPLMGTLVIFVLPSPSYRQELKAFSSRLSHKLRNFG